MEECETPRILIADDDQDMLKITAAILERKGFMPFPVASGEAALALLQETDFDAALIDLRLGETSGLEILSAIKERSPETECILLTGHATRESAIEAVQRNAFGYFQKPVDMNQLLLALRRAVEKRQAARALRESEEAFKGYFNIGLVGMCVTSPQKEWLEVNARLCQMLGYSREELSSRTWADLTHPDDLAADVALFEEVLAGRRDSYELDKRLIRKDGKTLHVSLYVTCQRNPDGSVRHFLASLVDVTERKMAEEKNREQAVALESAANGVVITDARGIIQWVNPAWSAMTGYSKEEAVGKNPRILKSGKHPLEFYKQLWDTILAGKVWRGEFINKRKDGTLYHEEKTIAPFLDESGSPKGFVAIAQDVTERKRMQEDLARANLRLQSLRRIDHALLKSALVGAEAQTETLRLLNALIPCEFMNLLALDEETQKARYVVRFRRGETFVKFTSDSARVGDMRLDELREQEIILTQLQPPYLNEMESKLYELGGRSFVKALLSAHGRTVGVLALASEDPDFFTEEYLEIIRDVVPPLALSLHRDNLMNQIRGYAEELETRVRERTAEIEAFRQRLELATRAGEIGVWEFDFKTGQSYWNERMYQIHGVTPQTHPAIEALDYLQFVHPDDKEAVGARLKEALGKTGFFKSENRIVRPDGSIRHISIHAAALKDAEQNLSRMVGVTLDVTERKQAEETMRRANAEMERALRMKDEFLANMSHELRTPLNAVMGISESLLEGTAGDLNQKQRKYVGMIYESGSHLLSLINDILDLSKIEAGRMTLDVSDMPVLQLAESALRMVKQMALKKNVSISLDLDERLKVVRCDSRRLLQMLVNLLSNAVKFTPEGGKAGLQTLALPEENQARFIVWDTGVGIEEKDLPRLFQPFTQLDGGLSRSSPGTGLGLALTMKMARLHGGNVSVESKPGEGSRFTIALPWSPSKREAPKTETEPPSAPLSPASRTGRILLAEDTESTLEFVTDFLQSRGHRVFAARDGFAALELAQKENPDLILLDIQMPGMDGFETFRRLRQMEALQNTPVIALTALAMSGDRERCLQAGMTDYLGKPIRLIELARMVESYLPEKTEDGGQRTTDY